MTKKLVNELRDNDHNVLGISYYLKLVLNIGLTMVLSISIAFAIGLFLVSKFNLPKLIIIILTALGVCGGFYKIYKEITRLEDHAA